MPPPRALEKSGVLLFFSLLSLIAAIIGFINGAECGRWLCSYFFLGVAVILFFWGFEVAQ